MKNKSYHSSHDGQKIYSRAVLGIYDFWVLGISNSFIWKCPTWKLLEQYNQKITGNHLEVGVGTGYFLDKCKFPHPNPKIVLGDLNPNSLSVCAKRIKRYAPETVNLDVLKPLQSTVLEQAPFDSIGIQYLLHCLPGTMKSKEQVLLNLKPLLSSKGTLFGATILGQGLAKSKSAQKLMSLYNSNGVFSNSQDSLEELKTILMKNFAQVSIQTEGTVAIFSAR